MDNLLSYFLKEPEREFYIRELARLNKRSPSTVSKYLKQYKREGLLISERRFNHLLYKADIENTMFKDRKLLYNIEKIRKSGLIDYLIKEYNHPEAIILFGSFKKADDIPGSDIDILIITPLKKESNLDKFERRLGHKIQLFLYSHEGIENMKRKNKELLNNMVNGMALYGFWEVFK